MGFDESEKVQLNESILSDPINLERIPNLEEEIEKNKIGKSINSKT